MTDERRLDRGYLLIADLTGYTAYLASAEPQHGPIIAGDFIETVVARLRSRFRLEKLEGDAAFMWAPSARVDGSALLDAIDAAYFGFQRRLQSLSQATTCDCESCRRMPQLDLKFVVHYGDVLRQQIAGRRELAGRDVIIAHRLLKGAAAERAGARNYVLITAAAATSLGLEPDALSLTALTEEYGELGSVNGYLLDLGLRWTTEQRRKRRSRPSGRLIGRNERLLPAAPERAWEFLTAPARRTTWEGFVSVDETLDGRRGVGSVAACVSGRLKTIEEILAWRPFEAFTRRVTHPQLGSLTAVYRIAAVASGTLLEVSWFAAGRRQTDEEAARSRDRFITERAQALERLSAALGREEADQLPLGEPQPA